jgi:hypothetical protein
MIYLICIYFMNKMRKRKRAPEMDVASRHRLAKRLGLKR